MGGEQFPVLVYGPNVVYECKKWIFDIFKIMDKKEFVKKNTPEEEYNTYDEYDIIDIFEEIFDGCYFSILSDFLSEYSFVNVYHNNFNWQYTSIGIQ